MNMEMEASGIVTTETHTDRIRAANREVLNDWKWQCPEFYEWICSFVRFGGNPIDAAVLEEIPGEPVSAYRATFFTEYYQYCITGRPSILTEVEGADDPGYLGATANCRKFRAGEDWRRGCDLADGNYGDETWNRILCDIVSHELVRLGK